MVYVKLCFTSCGTSRSWHVAVITVADYDNNAQLTFSNNNNNKDFRCKQPSNNSVIIKPVAATAIITITIFHVE